jgi:hypothetical protein
MSIRPSSPHAHRVPPSSSRLSNPQDIYVLVPRSPYSLGSSEPIGTRTIDSARNPPTPLRESNMPSASPLTAVKRKRSKANFDELEQRAPETKSKKQKVSTVTSRAKGATRPPRIVASNATAEFPNGFFYCHQCNKKRDSSGEPRLVLVNARSLIENPSIVGLYCTYKTKTSHSLARCKAKYCRPCLKNRYGQDLDEIKDRGINIQTKESLSHDKEQGYIFKYVKFVVPLSSSHCLPLLDVRDALVIVTVVGVAKPSVLNLLGTLRAASRVFVSHLFFYCQQPNPGSEENWSRLSCCHA